MEIAWACLLGLAVLDKRTRLLAMVLAAKWLSNYIGFRFVAEWTPAVIDVLFGAAGILLMRRCRGAWCDVVTIGFVVTPLAHAWFWMFWDAGMAGRVYAVVYFWMLAAIYTVQCIALSWPGGRRVVHFLVEHDWRGLAGRDDNVAPIHRKRSRDRRGNGGSV